MTFEKFCLANKLNNKAVMALLNISVAMASKLRRGKNSLTFDKAVIVYHKYKVIIYPYGEQALKDAKC